MKCFYIGELGTPDIIQLSGDEGIRRIFVYSNNATPSSLLYDNNIIGFFSSNNNIEIDFKSYYGFPKISDFSIEVSLNSSVTVLIDTVPASSVKDDYFEIGDVI